MLNKVDNDKFVGNEFEFDELSLRTENQDTITGLSS